MDEKYCAVCKTSGVRGVYKFPKDPILRRIWIQNTGIEAPVAGKVFRLCPIHFDSTQWTYRNNSNNNNNQSKVLSTLAVPTLYLKNLAPAPDPESYVPPLRRIKRTKCAVCYVFVRVDSGFAIFNEDDNYTDFGVALSSILRLTSRVVSSRYCCHGCAQEVLHCFDSIVNLNASTLLTTRMAKRDAKAKNEKSQKISVDGGGGVDYISGISGADGDTTERDGEPEVENSDRDVKHQKLEDVVKEFREPCIQCSQVLESKSSFTHHLLTHLLEEISVTKKSVAMTQTNDFEIEFGDSDLFFIDTSDCETSSGKSKHKLKNDASDEYEYLTYDHDDILRQFDLEAMRNEEGIEEVDADLLDDQKFWIHDEIETIETLDEETLSSNQTDEAPLNDIADSVESKYSIIKEEINDVHLSASLQNMNTIKRKNLKRIKSAKKVKGARAKEGGICHLCGQYLKSKESLGVHVALHKDTEEGPRECSICGTVLKNLKSLTCHIGRVHQDPKKNYKACDLCGQVRGNLYQHRKNCLQTMARAQNPPKRRLQRSTCGVCGKLISNFYLAKHLQLHVMEEDIAKNGAAAADKYLHACPYCHKKVKNVQIHLKQIHNIQDSQGEVRYFCEHCESDFQHRPLLVNHLVLKHNVDPRLLAQDRNYSWKSRWTCAVCGKVFASYKTIRTHTKIEHDGVGIDLNCEECGKHYNTLEALREHINVKHINYFPFHCKQCDRHFASEDGFTEHTSYYCRATGSKRKKVQQAVDVVPEIEILPKTELDSSLELDDFSQPKEPMELYEYVPQDDAVVFYVDV